MDAEAIYRQLLGSLPSERFHSPILAFEVIYFCTHSLALFDAHFLSILRLSFPSLFKACVGFIEVGPRLPSSIDFSLECGEVWG